MKLQLALVVTLAVIAGAMGWRVTRRRRRSFYDDKPLGMSDAAYEQREYRRYNMRRLGFAILYAALGAVMGWIISLLPVFR